MLLDVIGMNEPRKHPPILKAEGDSDRGIGAVKDKLRPFLWIKKAQYLEGGLSNRCIKLTDTKGQHYVWRPQGVAAQAFGLSRKNEFNALKIASQHALISAPVACFDEGLLTSWVEGDTLVPGLINVEMLSRLLVSVHQLPPLMPLFDPFKKAEHYFEQLSFVSKIPEIVHIHQYFQCRAFQSPLALTTIHCDLGYYNLIKQVSGEIKIIDWEYAAFGDPAFDLVLTSLANDISLNILVEHYCKIREIKDTRRWYLICERWKPVAEYLGLLWYCLGYELYGDEIYKERGNELLEKLKYIC